MAEEKVYKSEESTVRSFVRFINCIQHPIDIFWINYKGNYSHYSTIKPTEIVQINTYKTHPWICICHSTKERLLMNNTLVFFPKPFYEFVIRSGNRFEICREEVFVRFGMRKLQNLCKDVIKQNIRDPNDVESLELPHLLKKELVKFLNFDKSINFCQSCSGSYTLEDLDKHP